MSHQMESAKRCSWQHNLCDHVNVGPVSLTIIKPKTTEVDMYPGSVQHRLGGLVILFRLTSGMRPQSIVITTHMWTNQLIGRVLETRGNKCQTRIISRSSLVYPCTSKHPTSFSPRYDITGVQFCLPRISKNIIIPKILTLHRCTSHIRKYLNIN